MERRTGPTPFQQEALRRLARPEPLGEPVRLPRLDVRGGLGAGRASATRRLRSLWEGSTRVRATVPRPTPTILQVQEADCAAVALGIVLAFHGRHVPIGRLREDCGTSRDGTTAIHLVTAARGHGLDVHAYRAPAAALMALPMPCIVHWGFSHFLVVEGLEATRAWVNDPATGRRTLGLDAFGERYSGVVITLQPTPTFARAGQAPDLAARLWAALAPVRAGWSLALLLRSAVVVAVLLGVLMAGALVNASGAGPDGDTIRAAALAMTAAGVVALVLLGVHGLLESQVWSALVRGIAASVVERAVRLPMRFYATRFPTQVAVRAQSALQLADLLARGVPAVVASVAILAGTVVAVAAIAPPLALVLLVAGVASIAVAQNRAAGQDLEHERAGVMAVAIQGLQAIETIKATASEDEVFGRWADPHARLVTGLAAEGRRRALVASLAVVVELLATAIVIGVGGASVMSATLSAGGLVAALLLLLWGIRCSAGTAGVEALADDLRRLTAELDDLLAERIDPAVDERTDTGHPPGHGSERAARLGGALELRGVSFGYRRLEAPVVSSLDLRLAPSEWLAVVGRTGSGKSTVARLAAGLLQPWAGDVLIDGRPRSAHPRATLAAGIAMVDDAMRPFPGTFRENLTLWDPGVPEGRLRRAAEDACILDLVRARGGWDGRLNAEGRDLSSGQRQRLELARALVSEPVLLILDEATSELDGELEAQVLANLRHRGCSVLLVSHRLTSAQACDRVAVLEGGALTAPGTPAEVLSSEGATAGWMEASDR